MKLSKPSEDTLKGLAKLLKDLKGNDTNIMVAGTSQVNDALTKQVVVLEKDLRQLRKTLAELPEPGTIVGDGSGIALPGIGEVETTGMTLVDAPKTEDGSLKVLGHLYVTGDVVFQAVPDTDLKEGDMMVKGDLFVTGDINLPAPQQDNPDGYAVALYANPVQLDAGAMLLGVRKAEEGVFTEPLYRKPK